MLCKNKIWVAVKASLKADGIDLHDKEMAVKSLSQCCAASICISVYLEFFMEHLFQIRYWMQHTIESGGWVLTEPMSQSNAEKLIGLQVYEQAEIVNYVTSPPSAG